MQVTKNNAMTEQTGEGCPYPQISENAGMGQYDDQNFCICVHVLVICILIWQMHCVTVLTYVHVHG